MVNAPRRCGQDECMAAFVRKYIWVALYVGLIPFVNWSFTWAPNWTLWEGFTFNPVTIATGLILVVRDFAQREIGHRVILAMLVALGLTVWLAGPELALASGIAFFVSELVDWALFTFTKASLTVRVLLSTAIAAPIDTMVFLYFAESLREGSFTWANIVSSSAGKLLGLAVVIALMRWRERRNEGLPANPA
jgi:queuosine precursor transporter